MSNYFITFLSISIIIFVGYLTTIIIIGNKTLPKIGYIAVSFAAGCGILSLGMFVVSLFGVRFTLPNILVFLIPSIFCLVFINRLRRKKPNWPNSISHTFIGTQKLNPLGILLIIIISINVILCVIENVTLPIHNCTDATAIYGYKAKILYYEPIRYSNYFQDLTKSFSHLDYPLLWPLTETFVYIFLNQANDQFSKLLSPLFFVCLLLAMYSFVRISSGRTYSLFFAALLSTSPMLVYDSTLSRADVPLSLFYFLMSAFAYLWIKEQKPEYIIMSALFSSFLIFTKNEGSAFVLINLLILGILTAFNFDKTKFKQIILYLSIVCVLSSPWLVFRWNLSMDIDYPHLLNISNVLNNINILKYIFAAFVKEFLTFSKWNLLWVFLGLSTLLNFRYTLKLPVLYLTLLPFFSFLMYMVICIVEPSDINEKMYTLLFRLVIHFLPLAVFLMAEQLNPLFRREQK